MFLGLAIVLEVAGTSVMKFSQSSWPMSGMVIMYACIGVSYFSLSKAIRGLPLGVSYAFWEGIGLVLITLVSVFWLQEHFTLTRFMALAMVLLGTLLVHHGTESGPEARESG